jgi:hypothetical protein
MVDLDGVAPLHAMAGLAVRAEPGQADLANEARIAERVAEPPDLVEERGGPDVRVVGEAGHEVVDERCQWVRPRSRSHTGLPPPSEIGTDRLSIVTLMAGDRRDRPAPLEQCMCFHVFPMCEHAERVPLRVGCLVAASFGGGPLPRVDDSAHRAQGGEFQ